MTEQADSLKAASMENWAPHARSVEEVAIQLGTDARSGLDDHEVAHRRDQVGPNRIDEDAGPSRWQLAIRQFEDVLVLILIAAAAISGFVLGDWLEALVIFAIVIINAAIGFFQEAKAADAAQGLRRISSPEAKVIRRGSEHHIPTEEIVPGDVMVIETGDRVFADGRVASAARLMVDESELTGESAAVAKSNQATPDEVGVGDRTSMVYAGTVALSGRGTAIVTSTGPATEIGRIAGMLRAEEPPTPLEREMAQVGRRLGLIAGLVALVVFGVGLAQGNAVESMFLLAVALAVAAIPEGLPAVVGVTLGLGVQRMARLNAIVRRLPAVEALGAVTVVCTDKTGTLTRNEMTVQELSLAGERVTELSGADDDPRVRRYAQLAMLCNDARRTEDGWQGDPTEVALFRSAAEILDSDGIRIEWPRVDEIPFDSSRKRMTTVHRSGDTFLVVVKGAPEVVLASCSRLETKAGTGPLEQSEGDHWLDAASDMAARGLRTLTLAYREVSRFDGESDDLGADLVLVALIGMSDRVRDEAKASLEEAVGAGVNVVMITGDHEVTARAIAEELELLGDREVLTGGELHAIADEELEKRVDRVGVYARVDPVDKVKIVRAWQGRGDTVAMTGDGVNDAPALRFADIGVAMGSGTDVARDASDIVLADDNFATIVAAIRSGRTIFSNIRRVIAFLLAANVSEIIVVFVGFLIFSSLGDPLLATQILWVNLVTDGLPAVALGFDPPDRLVMTRPPGRRRSLLDRSAQLTTALRGTLLAGVVLLAYVYGVVQGLDWEVTRTLGFTTLVLVQLTYIYGLRVSESGWKDGLTRNALLHASIAVSVVFQTAVVVTQLGNRLFSTTPLSAEQWLISLGLAVLAFLAVVASSAVMPGESSAV